MSDWETTKAAFEKHVDDCPQCMESYFDPVRYCEIGNDLYSKAVLASQKDFDRSVIEEHQRDKKRS